MRGAWFHRTKKEKEKRPPLLWELVHRNARSSTLKYYTENLLVGSFLGTFNFLQPFYKMKYEVLNGAGAVGMYAVNFVSRLQRCVGHLELLYVIMMYYVFSFIGY